MKLAISGKGGVGKTSTCAHLAGTLALVGQPYQARRELETILESNQTVVDKQVLEQALRDLQEADADAGTEG